MNRLAAHGLWAVVVLGLVAGTIVGAALAPSPISAPTPSSALATHRAVPATPSPEANFTNSINRLVELIAAAGGGILALVWARVAFSWFSNDITKKVQAKDRARDALVGTLVFTAAITGLVWGLAQWVLTGA